MRFIERLRSALTGVALLAGCSSPISPDRPVGGGVAPAPAAPPGPAPESGKSPAAAPATAPPASTGQVKLPPPATPRNWNELKLQAARRLVAANAEGSYTSASPDVLLAIPVLEIDLNADGSIRRVQVLRAPTQAKDTTQLAINALHRAAPFGDVSRLPRPWRFTETFLFNDERKFKPRSLD